MEATAKPESLRDLVIRMTKESWERKEGLLLARLGDELTRKQELAKAELGGRRLAAYIREELADEIALYTTGQDSIVRLALPKSAGITQEQAIAFFPKATPLRKAAEASGVTNAVIQAFSRDLAAGKKRVITLSPTIRYRDIDEGSQVQGAAKVIPRGLIVTGVGPIAEERLRKILDNIAAWRANEELAPTAITKKPDDPVQKNLLSLLLSNLSDVDRKRVQIPLDIVAKLLHTQVK